MAKPNFLDCIDGLLGHISWVKLAEFVPFLAAQHRSTMRKLEECKQRYKDLVSAAHQQGLSETQLMRAAVASSSACASISNTPDAEATRLKLLVEYVRADKQRIALMQLQQNATALSVALPGNEGRALHARGQDNTRREKLAKKLGELMTKLQLAEPLQPGSPDYQAGLAALRDEELQSLQAEIEKHVSALAVIKHERLQQGAASSITRSQRKSLQNRRKRVRQLVAVMHSWQQLQAPSSSVVQQLPREWTDTEVAKLFQGEYPWRQAAAGAPGPVAAVLAERFRDVCAEEARTIEELVMQRFERARTKQYLLHMRDLCRQAGLARQLAADQLDLEASAHVQAGDLRGCTTTVKEQLHKACVNRAQAVLLERSAVQFEQWFEQAVASLSGLSP